MGESELAERVREALVGKTKRDDQVAAIVALIEEEAGLSDFREAFPHGAMVQTETVEAYGLTLGLDANGDACYINFPYGAQA